MLPSYSVLVTRRVPCSQVTSRPCRSRVFPLPLLEGSRKTVTAPVASLQQNIRLSGTSENSRVAPVAEPHGTFEPATTGPQPLDDLLAHHERAEALVDHLDGGVGDVHARSIGVPCARHVPYPRPTNGILVAITVSVATFVSSGKPAM